MSTITVSELKRKPTAQWRRAARAGDLVVMAQGEPLAVLLPVDAASLEPTMSALRSARALQAQKALQEAAQNDGTAKLALQEINAEIAATRRARRE